jgi:hypothetical protein
VRRFDGFVAEYMGDGALIYFGYPRAREADAERAVRVGLELLPAVTGLKSRVSLQTRIGIATGLVVRKIAARRAGKPCPEPARASPGASAGTLAWLDAVVLEPRETKVAIFPRGNGHLRHQWQASGSAQVQPSRNPAFRMTTPTSLPARPSVLSEMPKALA